MCPLSLRALYSEGFNVLNKCKTFCSHKADRHRRCKVIFCFQLSRQHMQTIFLCICLHQYGDRSMVMKFIGGECANLPHAKQFFQIWTLEPQILHLCSSSECQVQTDMKKYQWSMLPQSWVIFIIYFSLLHVEISYLCKVLYEYFAYLFFWLPTLHDYLHPNSFESTLSFTTTLDFPWNLLIVMG